MTSQICVTSSFPCIPYGWDILSYFLSHLWCHILTWYDLESSWNLVHTCLRYSSSCQLKFCITTTKGSIDIAGKKEGKLPPSPPPGRWLRGPLTAGYIAGDSASNRDIALSVQTWQTTAHNDSEKSASEYRHNGHFCRLQQEMGRI